MADLIVRLSRTLRPFGILKNLFRKPMTLQFPYETLPPVEGYRGRQTLDLEKCAGCFICSMVCPNKAIWPAEFKGRKYPQVNLGKCCWCQLCEEYCPQGAIKLSAVSMMVTMDKDTALLGLGEEGFVPRHK
jgi:formate hydrogenlyase subunit 6/NADH:ubiquinone oxidoreductase subunit I